MIEMETYTIYQAKEILTRVQSTYKQKECEECNQAIEYARQHLFTMKFTVDTVRIHFMVDEITSS